MAKLFQMDELWKYKVYAKHSMVGAGSVALGTTITYPFDTIKVILQVGSSPNKKLTTIQAIQRIRQVSGYSGLFSGLGWLSAGRILGMGSRFVTYEILIEFFKDIREQKYCVYPMEALKAGVIAGAIESLLTSPFELIKIRSQVIAATRISSEPSVKDKGVAPPNIQKLLRGHTPDKKLLDSSVNLISTLSKKHPNLTGFLQEYPWMMTGSGSPPPINNVRRPSEIYTLEGWRTFWRGLRPMLVRDTVYGGVFFSTWNFLHQAMLKRKAYQMDPIPRWRDEDIGPPPPLHVTLAAGVSGMVAAAASHCFDTSSCRSRCTVQPKYVTMERKICQRKEPRFRTKIVIDLKRMTGIHPGDKGVLFKGLPLRMARCGIGSFLVVGSYFLAVDELVSRGTRLT